MASRPQSPPSTHLRPPPAREAPKDSAVSRLLIAPLTFISFLLSLALIDSRNHSLRTHSHPPPQAPTTILGRIKSFFHHCIYKRTPSSPYAYISESSTSVSLPKEKEPWHWHTKQRKMMKAEFSDAYRMRNSVLVAIVALGVLGVAGMTYVAVGFAGWARFLWTNWDGSGKATVLNHVQVQEADIIFD